MHSRSRMTIQPRIRDGARRVFSDQADIGGGGGVVSVRLLTVNVLVHSTAVSSMQ